MNGARERPPGAAFRPRSCLCRHRAGRRRASYSHVGTKHERVYSNTTAAATHGGRWRVCHPHPAV